MTRQMDRPWCKSLKEKSELFSIWVEGSWIQKQDILPPKSYACAYISLALSCDTTYYRPSVLVVSKADVIKHMLSMPILNGRVGKWILVLSEFDLRYESAKVVKGQIMADFVTQHHKPSIDYVEPMPWTLFFDGSSCKQVVALVLLLFHLGG